MKKNIKNKKLILILTILLLSILIISSFILYNQYNLNKNGYIKTKNRETYIIKQFDETYLSKYLQKENILVIFFSSTCKYCVEEANGLNEFITSNPKIPVIMVSHDKTNEALNNYLSENNFNWFVILDTDKKIRSFIDKDATGIPSNYLINKDGVIVNHYKGPLTKDEFLDFYNGVKFEAK